MTVLERKARFVKAVLDEKIDESMLSELEIMLSLISTQAAPCLYSIEELKIRAKQGIVDAENGLGKSISQLREKHRRI